jgi:L-aspartate oxidase
MDKKNSEVVRTDHLVLGSGIAGLLLALKLARTGKVIVLAKGSPVETNTNRAQGGIAAVLDPEDSFAEHIEDTERAGVGLCRHEIVEMVVKSGPKLIEELIERGVRFTEKEGDARPVAGADRKPTDDLHLTREGGHSKRRVAHAADETGREVMRALLDQCAKNDNITVMPRQIAIDLLTTDKYAPTFSTNYCLGAYVLDQDKGLIYQIRSRLTYLCTGGHGKVYLYTSNNDNATGDGLAMAYRAGCKVANLEFMQFHPTCLYHPKAKSFLISEAVRGEGAILKNLAGEPFVNRIHPMGSLAPRDIVTKAIDAELKRSGAQHVYLDARGLGEQKIKSHFPNIYQTCLKFGVDMINEMIPVVPAAHYSCGGVVVDSCGRTNIAHLYAVGEVACTGLHGANRLASNSLLEALVFADRVAEHIDDLLPDGRDDIVVPGWNPGDAMQPDEYVVLTHIWDEIRRLMWNYVGIMRTTKRLQRALERITLIRNELNRYYWNHELTDSFLEARNLADVAYLTIRCALSRKESRGIHFNIDFPEMKAPKDTII